jgi:hypothetical protein
MLAIWNGLAYLRDADRVRKYMQDFHGPAWQRLNRRWLVFRRMGVRLHKYYGLRKANALEEIIWCWRMPLRDRHLTTLITSARNSALAFLLAMTASLLVVVLFEAP